MPPALRGRKSGSGDAAKLQARVRGLLNRLAESNLPGIAAEVAQLMADEGRLAVTQAVCDELLSVSNDLWKPGSSTRHFSMGSAQWERPTSSCQ